MKWIASLTLLFALAGGVLAAGTDDQYLDILGQILQADTLQGDGHLDAAAVKYRDAQEALEKLHADHPKFDEAIVGFRLEYLAGKLKQLGQYLPGSTNAPAAAPAMLTPQQQLAALQGQISALTAANEQLRQKIKEALSVQPAAVAPGELAKAQEKIVALQKERDLLQVALEQEKAAKASVPSVVPVKAAAEPANIKYNWSMPVNSVLDIYSDLVGRTALQTSAGSLAVPSSAVITLKTQSLLTRGEAIQALETLLGMNGITIVPVGQKFFKVIPAAPAADLSKTKTSPAVDRSLRDIIKDLTAERDKLKEDLAAVRKEPAGREAYPGAAPAALQPAAEPANIVYNWTMPADQVLAIYSDLVGRTALQAFAGPLAVTGTSQLTLKTESPLTHDEAIRALETLLGMNGIAIVPFGEKFFKVVSTAAAADLSKPKTSPADELAALKTQSSKDAKAASSKIDDLERQLEETRKRLAGATAELDTLKSRPSADSFKELAAERDQLKKDLAAKSKELAEQEAHPQAAPAAPSQDAIKLKQVEQERDELAKQVAAVARLVPNPGAGEGATLSAENNGLRAQLAVLEAGAVPYTSEELAVLNAAAPAIAPAQIPAAGAETTHKPHSVRELPPGAGELMTQAQRAAEEQHDYVQAEQKYLEVLAQDPDNVYVLVHLGLAQYGEGHLDDCEKNVHHALTLDPEDAGALYLLGILRYRQEKWDESLDALSRSASINPTNSSTQYSLGCVLAAKGLRSKAETAFRKALEIDPLYADAHYNLAFVYATEKPPAPALARWHYQRAVALGHAKSSDLEKLLGGGP
ncbi:MAG: tetratricopeptide repeat protein [Verrucomicrobiota bacterium]